MFHKRKANVYMDMTAIYYVIKEKKNLIKGKIVFSESDAELYSTRMKLLRKELKELAKKRRVKEFNLIISEGMRMVKVFDLGKEVKLNSDLELILKDNISKYIQPSENMNDYSIHYLATEKKLQSIFLTSVIYKKTILELNTYAIQDALKISLLTIPEVAMYELLKTMSGVNSTALYNEGLRELKILVSKGDKLIYANQVSDVDIENIPSELHSLKEYVGLEFKESIGMFHLIGADELDLTGYVDIKHIDVLSEEMQDDTKFMLLVNM